MSRKEQLRTEFLQLIEERKKFNKNFNLGIAKVIKSGVEIGDVEPIFENDEERTAYEEFNSRYTAVLTLIHKEIEPVIIELKEGDEIVLTDEFVTKYIYPDGRSINYINPNQQVFSYEQ